eukprot:m.242213 g.242213  ORF g.242213 m.242213 type:complete len:77 (+) comp19437_c1_seq4:483-713(+)
MLDLKANTGMVSSLVVFQCVQRASQWVGGCPSNLRRALTGCFDAGLVLSDAVRLFFCGAVKFAGIHGFCDPGGGGE